MKKRKKKQLGISAYFQTQPKDTREQDVAKLRRRLSVPPGEDVAAAGRVQIGLHLHEQPPANHNNKRQEGESARDEFYCKLGVVHLPEEDPTSSPSRGAQKKDLTPLEKQVALAKKSHPDLVLLFEVGYRYRFFGDDAELASKVLRIACYRDHCYMTASVPAQRVGVHVVRLVERGYKVGIVSQTETAAIKASSTQGKNKQAPFQRSLSALYTRSVLSAASFPEADTSLAEINLSDVTSHHLTCVLESNDFAVAFVALNVSNGDLTYHYFPRRETRNGNSKRTPHTNLQSELQSFLLCLRPCELLISSSCSQETKKAVEEVAARNEPICGLIRIEERTPESSNACDVSTLLASFGSKGQDILHALCHAEEEVVGCIRMIAEFLKQMDLESVLESCQSLHSFKEKGRMNLPAFSVKALELFQNGNDKGTEGSLISLIDRTRSAMGSRLVRRWLLNPLQCIGAIAERQDCVQDLVEHHDLREEVNKMLQVVPDVEKLIARVHNASARPSDFIRCVDWLKGVCRSLGALNSLEKESKSIKSSILKRCLRWGESDLFASTYDILAGLDAKAAREDDKRKMFTCHATFPKVFERVMQIRAAKQDLQDLLPGFASLLQVRALKYTSIQNQGNYLIELPENQAGVPESWTKVCATKRVNRWQPVEVKEKLRQMELLQEYLDLECHRAWKIFLDQFRPRCNEMRSLADTLAELDVLSGFASLCLVDTFTRPQFVTGEEGSTSIIEIEDGRHPLLDHSVCTNTKGVVPNDTHLCSGVVSTMVISGPNAGGKTMFIKQVALLCVMAHIGCFVPAKSARLAIIDGLFVRMGAEDSLSQGLSTFQVELMEASVILRESTHRSLIVLDELGRGTSTHDGLSLAMATLLHLVSQERNPLTLFVTHYQEILEALEKEKEEPYGKRARPFFVSYVEDRESHEVTYLYKMKEGRCPSSFGFNVARNAGIPQAVVHRAMLLSQQMRQNKV
jgi:DNA mismatch repair protein MSH3